MHKSHIIWTSAFLILLLGIWVFATNTKKPVPPSSPSPVHVLGSESASVTILPSSCHENNGLPDPTCTPGSIDPKVTQENIHQTICVSGYTKTVRPSVSYTQALKKQQIAQYGYSDTNLHDYEEDHLVSLELGGNPTDPGNLWPEPGASPNEKDSVENLCNQKVCDGEISLKTAQEQIASNWKTACQ